MPTERIQRQIDSLLDSAADAVARGDWEAVRAGAEAALRFDPHNEDARAYLDAANADGTVRTTATAEPAHAPPSSEQREPESFAGGRYGVRRFLGEGGKKRVFLAHDQLLDRDVAFALIKTDGLDEIGRERILCEAQAMGRMGTHPHIVSIFDFGEEQGAPYVVTELMAGGDVEGLLEQAEGPLPVERTLEIGMAVAKGLVFAHAQGIVHRDLKPGNVWLTSDGVAKIGDFGLAVTEGRSRLTQHGMMVGTYGYMPPEQALGGEATAQSDLYSLGCMLYELVTGKPPFQGDSPLAVITQHLNTAPVAPSWHTDACPSALEDLVLQLMAKVAADRPTSAQAVVNALERINPEERGRSHSGDSANPLDRLARGVFVGRERELERLRAAFEDAFAGRGSVVMLVGEPGIGKTRAAQELETYARMRGAKVLWGRAHESAGAPPYWPWVQVGRAYRAQTDDELLTSQLRADALELQRLFPALRQRFPELPEAASASDEGAQFRLFDAYASFLHIASNGTPLVVVLDDLHWADQPTLQLLAHLAREVSRSRLLVLGTYRDTDLDRTHPLSAALAELNREQLFIRIAMRGLERNEVASYIQAVADVAPATALIDAVHRETEGNPFFLEQVVNLLAEEGALTQQTLREVSLPDGVKEALGRRLDRLSTGANELLALAAVCGREFTHPLLAATSGVDEEHLLDLIEEALRARVIEEGERPATYQFAHALMQETLLAELSTARRVRTHARIGEALELEHARDLAPNAAELARHFSESSVLNGSDSEKAARYSLMAAQFADTMSAWDEAARHYGRAITLLDDAGDAFGMDEAALHHGLGVALRQAGDWPGGYAALDRAMAFYRERGDGESFGRSALEAIEPYAARPRTERDPIVKEALAFAPTRSLWAALAVSSVQGYFDPAADELAEEARAIAESSGLTDLLAQLRYRDGNRAMLEGRHEAIAIFREAIEMGSVRTDQRVNVLNLIAGVELAEGRVDDALATCRREWEPAALAARSRFFQANARAAIAMICLLRGDLVAADIELSAAEEIESNAPVAFARTRLLAVGGDLKAAIQLLTAQLDFVGAAATPIRGLLAYYLLLQREAQDSSVREAFAAFLEMLTETDAAAGLPSVMYRASGVEVIAAIGEDSTVRDAYELLTAQHTDVGYVRFIYEAVDYLRGLLALRLDLLDAADSHFSVGLATCERERTPIEAGRCHQGLAEVAERRGDHALATEHLDSAGELFARHGAKLYLDQVLAKKELLKA